MTKLKIEVALGSGKYNTVTETHDERFEVVKALALPRAEKLAEGKRTRVVIDEIGDGWRNFEVCVLNPGERQPDGLVLMEPNWQETKWGPWSIQYRGKEDFFRSEPHLRYNDGKVILLEWYEAIRLVSSGTARFIGVKQSDGTYRGYTVGGIGRGIGWCDAADMIRQKIGLILDKTSFVRHISAERETEILRHLDDGWVIEDKVS